MPVPISNPNCSAPHSARCWTSSGTRRAFSGTRKRHRPISRPSTTSAATPNSAARTGGGISACGSAPSTAATPATSRAPSRRPPPNQRRTGLPRQTDALSRNAELWLQVEPELANPAAHPAATASSGPDAAVPGTASAAPAPKTPNSASAGVSGCSARRAAPLIVGPSPQGGQQRRRVVGLVAAVLVLDLVVRLLGNRVGQLLLGEGAGRDGDAGVLGAVVVRRGGDGVGTADALPPPGVTTVAVGGQPRRVELHPSVGEGALAVVAALARVGAALPSAVAGGLAALLPVVGLLVVGGGLAGAVLGPVRRCRRGLPPRQVPVERHERAGRDPEDQGTQDGAPAGPVPAQVRHDGAGPSAFGWGGGG